MTGTLMGCASCMTTGEKPLLETPMRPLDDKEGSALPLSLPPVVDGHVHLFPDALFEAIWQWFDTHAWPVRYKLDSPAIIRFLLDRGVKHLVALHYAHKPGIARTMNRYMAAICESEPRVTGLATVFPGEDNAADILTEAFGMGLAGVKLHCHVQCFSPDSPQMHAIYTACDAHQKPIVIHAGREPASPAYHCDPYALCAVERIEYVLRDYPTLKVCVPHFGADELDGYTRLLQKYDNLWLDTAMTLGAYFPFDLPKGLMAIRPERVLFGTDFPNLPYAWDREVRFLVERNLQEDTLAAVLGGTAAALYGLTLCET